MRPTSYPPQHRVVANDVERLTRREESMRGDNTAAWERRCVPVVEYLRSGPKRLREVARWGYGQRVDGQRMGAVMAEECLFWLLAQGRVERVDGMWRLV